jgi:hypothetical protein
MKKINNIEIVGKIPPVLMKNSFKLIDFFVLLLNRADQCLYLKSDCFLFADWIYMKSIKCGNNE